MENEMLKRYLGAAIAVSVLVATTAGVYAAGLWSTLPLIGGASYCASTVTGTGNLSGPTGQGQGTIGSICGQTVPAGPATFAGTEYSAFDLFAQGTNNPGGQPSTANVNINQLGQGVVVDSVASGAAITIPNNSQFFVLDTGTATTVAVTMPASAVEGQIQHIECIAAVSTAFSVVANTGQTIKGSAPATCTAGTGLAWRYVASANGIIVANSWLRIQ
jgi:hypothetical protein